MDKRLVIELTHCRAIDLIAILVGKTPRFGFQCTPQHGTDADLAVGLLILRDPVGLDLTIRGRHRQFAPHPKPGNALQNDIIASIGQRRAIQNPPDTAHGEQLALAIARLDHADQLIALHRILDHRAITRFKDMQRQASPGKEQGPFQREDRQG